MMAGRHEHDAPRGRRIGWWRFVGGRVLYRLAMVVIAVLWQCWHPRYRQP